MVYRNRWHNYITKWIEKGAIAWCGLKEVKTPYEVEKIVKKVLKPKKDKCRKTAQKADKSAKEEKNENNNVSKIDFSIEESQHIKTGELIWLVKIKNNLSREDFQKIKKQFSALKGYYSTFTHSFIFKYNPTENLVF